VTLRHVKSIFMTEFRGTGASRKSLALSYNRHILLSAGGVLYIPPFAANLRPHFCKLDIDPKGLWVNI